ncbi:radical SAM protein [archaeon]|jgi:adenine C2-methylase RlmN of 23S rRNA A2503 and tRNA A37|nr:radical SAM protein [archaeon]MBT3451255.1 radical SAM protein [archaeon]MBT6869433.1 radical SAM protein [archaeon]MBT7192596.1 radical SAM protein [archaeon]MBT7380672.1 radical SAM protein [archaeon]
MDLELIDKLIIPNGHGYIFKTPENLPVFVSDTTLEDKEENLSKWKIGVSLTSGCNVNCIYCFTNHFNHFKKLSVDEIVEQVEFVYNLPEHSQYSFDQTKIEFKEMGDPACNHKNLCDSIRKLKSKYDDILYVVSTAGVRNYNLFEELKKVHDEGANIRLQFSCHTTSDLEKKILSPKLKMLTNQEISNIINDWYDGNSKVTLTYVPFKGFEFDTEKIKQLFDTEKVFIKISYVDETDFTKKENLYNMPNKEITLKVQQLRDYGFSCAYRNKQNI